MDCIFCKIIAGEIPSAKVYEDNDVFAFLDVFPLTKGHALVIPKIHFENIFDISEEVLQKIIIASKNLSQKIKTNLKADGIRLSQSNGKLAHQEIMHFHMHIIPRYENDGIAMDETGRAHPQKADFEELKKVAQEINK